MIVSGKCKFFKSRKKLKISNLYKFSDKLWQKITEIISFFRLYENTSRNVPENGKSLNFRKKFDNFLNSIKSFPLKVL